MTRIMNICKACISIAINYHGKEMAHGDMPVSIIVPCAMNITWPRKYFKERGFHVIHGCNPPDDIYLVAKPFKKHGVDYVFDHHDICPELYEAKFGKKSGLLYKRASCGWNVIPINTVLLLLSPMRVIRR